MCYRPSIKLMKLLDEVRTKRLVKEGLLAAPAEEPICIIPPLPPDVEAAAEARDAAKARVDKKMRQLHEHPVAKAPNCLTFRRKSKLLNRAKDNAFMLCNAVYCGRSAETDGHLVCPFCFRRRLTKILSRMATALLDAPPQGDDGLKNLPRTEMLHVGETAWSNWETFDKSVRRAHGGSVGRLRIRKTDNTVIVICERPFRGSKPIAPADACDLALAAIDDLHKAKHSFRILGSWLAKQEAEWKIVEQHKEVDYPQTLQNMVKAGIPAKPIKSREIKGIFYRPLNAAQADLARSLIVACPTNPKEENSSTWDKSDEAGIDEPEPPEEEHETPFEGEEGRWD